MQIDSSAMDASIDHQALQMLRDVWIQFCGQMKHLRDIFLYLERTYLASEQNMAKATSD